mmetsp:Transcript_93005/g.265539  ORF Transcript_93005/g.265539 Transcript_93005/m.265539 type:complete len:218 (-) Transcript_93005:1368-2021(-)
MFSSNTSVPRCPRRCSANTLILAAILSATSTRTSPYTSPPLVSDLIRLRPPVLMLLRFLLPAPAPAPRSRSSSSQSHTSLVQTRSLSSLLSARSLIELLIWISPACRSAKLLGTPSPVTSIPVAKTTESSVAAGRRVEREREGGGGPGKGPGPEEERGPAECRGVLARSWRVGSARGRSPPRLVTTRNRRSPRTTTHERQLGTGACAQLLARPHMPI